MLFESDRFAILLIIAFTVKNIVKSGKSHAHVLVYPIFMGVAFIEPKKILYDHNIIIVSESAVSVKKDISKYPIKAFGTEQINEHLRKKSRKK